MKFSRRSETLQISGQDVIITELSAAEFEQVMAVDTEAAQLSLLIQLSLGTDEDVMSWPNSVVTQLATAVMNFNGMTDSPN
jgi:uncharacterized coiled-coil protein SlyX